MSTYCTCFTACHDELTHHAYVACRTLLDAWEMKLCAKDSYQWPVFVIDEANALMSWSNEHAVELKGLLAFFVSISKQRQRCHVLMATSEYGYQAWLNSGELEWLQTVYVGQLPVQLQDSIPLSCRHRPHIS